MITKVNNSIVNLKNLFIEIFLNKTNKVTNVADGSVLNAVAFGAAKIAQKAIKDIAIIEAKIFPETATGDFLDKAAALYGVSQRKGALGSSTYVRVYAKPNTKYGFDNYFLSKNGLRFSIDEETIVDSTGYAYIKVRSINAGYITNVDANSITNIVPIPDGHIECTNEYMATGGRDSEDDETFRLRIKTNLNILSKGTLEYFTQVFQNIDDRILRVMNVGLGEDGIYEIYLVTQNGIYLTDDELTSLLEKSKSYFGLSELNLQGDVIGIRLKNVEWFYIGSERGIDFRVELDPDYEVADVRKNIQVGITKYLDFRFWKAGKIVQWDDLLDVVKKTEGVKYVPDEYFFPYYDQGVPLNQLPRVKGFIMKDLEGKVLYDSNSTLSPMFYPKEEEDLFRGLSDTTLSLRQAVYFFVRDEEGRPVKGARITISSSSILTDDSGKAVISLVNGAYDYIINADLFTENQGSFVVLNGSITINAVLIFAPYVAHFTVVNTRDEVLEGAAIVINEVNTYTTNINGEANISLKVGSYTYSVDILGYKSIVGSVEIVDSDIYIPVTMQDQEWIQTIFVREDISKEPIKGVIVTVDKNNYITDSEGKVELSLINGTYSVEINAVGYNDKQTIIRVNNSPATTIVSMTLIKFNVTIVVYDDNNKLVSGVNVIINEGEYIMQTSKNGEVEFKLTNGTYRLQILSSSYDDIESTFQVQNSDIGFNYTLQPKHYIATMIILDSNNEAIKDAIVTVDSDSQLTNELGVVKFSLYNGIYPYTVEKLGYYAGLGNITIDKSDISNVIKLTSQPWDIILFVKDGDTYLTEANININGQSYITDSEGKVELSLINGTYSYTITKLGYSDATGNLVVENKNTTVDIAMYLKPYTTTFTVISRGNRVSGATIVCEGVSVITNDQGIAEIGLVNGDHSYTVTKSGYVNYSGLITVNNNEQNIIVDFEAIVYSCSIVVKDTDTNKNLVSSVSVVVGGETKWTNENGQVEFSLSSGVYNVILSKEGYLEKTAIIEISSATSIELSIDKIYQLSFVVSGTKRSFLSDATIVITGDAVVPDSPTSEKKKILVTDSEGKTSTIDVINGACSYGVSHSGYSSETGVLTIQDGSLIKEVDLIYGIKTIFVVKDQESNIIEGATILIDNVNSQLTDETGEASFYLSNGTHTYLISKTGYKGVSGSVTVNDEQQTIDIGLVLGAKVTFNSVLDGAVLPGMTIVIKDGDSFVTQGITNNQGQFVAELTSGTYTVICGDDETSFANNTQQIIVGTEDLSVTFEMKLYIYRSLTVFVKYRTTVIEDASIYITGTVNGVKYDNVIKTDSEGKAVFTKIINGDYSCLITKEGYQDYSDTITVSGDTEVTKIINQYHTVILTYTDFRGIAISGLSINREGLEAKQTDENGQVTYTNELDGSFVVSFIGVDPYQSNSTEIIVSGEDVSQTIKLDSIYTVNITVKDGQNDIVPNIVVNVYRAGGVIASGTTNSSGIVSFRLVASSADCYARIVDTSEFISAGSVAYFSVVDRNIDLSLGCYFMITFQVTAKGNYISSSSYLVGAEIIEIKDGVEGESHSTNSLGIATWSLPYDEGISYGCKLVGTSNWNEASETFSVSKSSHIAELFIVGDMLYTFTFNVKRSGSNISNVEILLRTSIGYQTTKYTDTSGNATFGGVATYSLGSPIDVYYEVSASNNSYYKSIGTTYISSPITSNRNINISVVPLYDLRFRETNGLSGVSISLTGSTSGYGTTDSSGICSFDKLESTSLNYTATKDGYITVEGTITLTGTSETIEESFTMEKDSAFGVFIQATDGTLVRPSRWASSGKTANCIAVVTENAKFGIALRNTNYMTWINSNQSTTILSVFIYSLGASVDYYGQQNSNVLYRYNTSYASVASTTRSFVFPNGKKGYCGSLGEWQMAYNNKSDIVSAMSIAEGESISTSVHWSSSQGTESASYGINWSSGSVSTYDKKYPQYVRAFCSLYSTGIYIQGTDGRLYTTSEWSSRPSDVSANCVAVIGDDVEFGIALQDAYSSSCSWDSKKLTLNTFKTTSASSATSHYGGFADTFAMSQLAAFGHSDVLAAKYCYTFVFPNGKKGYLGSMGEWIYAEQNQSAIDNAISAAGGTAIRNDYYWTSTQYNIENSWTLRWAIGGSYSSKTNNHRVRAFVHL